MPSVDVIARSVRTQLKFKIDENQFAILAELYGNEVRYLDGVCYFNQYLEPGKPVQVVDERTVQILNTAPEIIPTIVIGEWGGYDPEKSYGVAQVICGLSGKPLMPFYTSEEPNKEHATFGVPKAVVVCRASHHSDRRWQLSIYDVKFAVDNYLIEELTINEHWCGSRFNEAKRRYVSAMAFAVAKASTPYCAGAAYYQVRQSDMNLSEDRKDATHDKA